MCVNLTLGDLNPSPCPSTLYKHLYLWSVHHTKDVRWSSLLYVTVIKCYNEPNRVCIKLNI